MQEIDIEWHQNAIPQSADHISAAAICLLYSLFIFFISQFLLQLCWAPETKIHEDKFTT